MHKMVLSLSRYCMRYYIRLFPGNVFRTTRNYLWRLVGFRVHRNANVLPTASLICWDIEIGANTFVGEEVMITGGKILIESNCDIAPRCILHAGSHEPGIKGRRAGMAFGGEIKIGAGCWLGTNTTILAGVELGQGIIVAAGSVVTAGCYPNNVLLAGVPAQIKKRLKPLKLDSVQQAKDF